MLGFVGGGEQYACIIGDSGIIGDSTKSELQAALEVCCATLLTCWVVLITFGDYYSTGKAW